MKVLAVRTVSVAKAKFHLSDNLTRAELATQGRQRGFTLVELVMVIVLMGVIGGMVAVFMKSPIDAYVAGGRRAALTDVADTVVRRMARDIQRALPNSIRSAGDQCVEFIPTKAGGRYREAGSGALDFTTAVTSFNMLGSNDVLPADQKIANGDLVAIFNLGISGADAYAADNTSAISADPGVAGTPPETAITLEIAGKKFPFESPSRRFHVIASDEQVVRYVCVGAAGLTDLDANGRGKGTLYRQVLALPLAASACPSTAPTAAAAVMAKNVSACSFDYSGPDLQRNALVSMTLSITDSSETVSLRHDVHVSNEP